MPANHQIAKLQLPPDLHEQYSVIVPEGEDQKVLTGLSQINLFVGSNNSGKSRLLRRWLKTKKLSLLPTNFPEGPAQASRYLKENAAHLNSQMSNAHIIERIPDYSLISEGEVDFRDLRRVQQDVVELARHYNPMWELEHQLRTWVPEDLDTSLQLVTRQRIYIPTLRGLRPLPDKSDDVYAARTLKDYFEDTGAPVFSGLSLYKSLQEMLLGERQERTSAERFQRFLSEELFQGQAVTLIPKIKFDVIHIKIGNEKEKPIHELGDGIQQIIILTFPLFRSANEPTLVFIEEPELFLHPGMQRSLILAMRRFPNYQYFISTHSNHLLDLTLELDDISIYAVRKSLPDRDDTDASFLIEPCSTHDTRLLDLLGARVSSVFLSNCTVWVEGITDRRYLAHGLELYLEHLEDDAETKNQPPLFRPRQDYHYSFVEYSGGNITHWSFLDDTPDPIEVTRLCAKLMLIADKDDDKKISRHQKLKEELGDNFVPLACREIENLLTPAVLKKVLVEYGEDESAIPDFKQADYKTEYLGTFLDQLLKSKKRKGSYAESSGTVTDKKGFCAKAIKNQTSWQDLSPEAQKLVKRIYAFIQEHNR